MKKKILLMLFPLLAMSLTACDKGGNPDPAPVEKVVDSIVVKTQPTKTIYAPGESFDASGMVLTVNYVGGTSDDVTSGWTLNPAGPLNVSDTKVTVTYGGKSVDVAITVTEEVALSLDKSTATIDVGASVQVTATVVNTEEAVVWSIDKTNIASLSPAGKVATVTGVAKGTATLKATVAGKEKTCVITVNEKGVETDYGTEENPISISAAAAILDTECANDGDLTKQAITAIGEVKAIRNTFSYESGPCFEMDMTDGSKDVYLYRCHATEELAAKVAVGSTVKFVGYGKNFKGTKQFADNGSTLQCHVLSATSTDQPYLSLDKTTVSVEVEKTVQIVATVLNTEDPVVWSLEGDAASLSYNGNVATITGVSEGTATLKATVAGLEKTCAITVTAKGEETDYGTEDSPISISAAAAILEKECANENDMTKQAITAIGEVKAIRNTFSYESGPCFEMDMTDGSKDVYLYRCHATEELAAKVAVGSTVKFVGYAKNFRGTKEFVDNGGDNPCHVLSATATDQPALLLDKTTATVEVEKRVQITATVLNTQEAVVWSLEGDAASLSFEGKVATVTGVSEGSATLKATVAGLEKTCAITVTAKGEETDYGTEDSPISISAAAAILEKECANEDDMTKQAITAIGEVKEIKNTFDYESGPCFEMYMTDGSSDVYLYRCHATEELAAKVAVGSTVKFVGYAKNFRGTKEFVDNGGANQCHVLSAQVVVKDVKSVDSIASGIPSFVYVGDKITASNVVLNVTYSNDETGTENATSIVLDTSVAAKDVAGKAYYGDTLYADFTIDVEPKPADPVIGKTFTKITSDAELVDGTYMIVYEDDTSPKVSNGTETPVAATIENYSIVGVEGQGAFEIKAMTGGYYIKAINGDEEGKYLSGTSGSNKTNFNEEPQANTISITDGEALITSNTSVLRFNSQSNIFRYYKESSYASQAAVSLYKQGETKAVESVAVTGSLTKPIQYVGDTFDPTGLTVTATYEGGEEVDVTSKATWSVSELTAENPALEVTASFGGETSSAITVAVEAVSLTSMEIVVDASAVKKNYVVGDAWSSQGISVKGHYNNGSEGTLNAEDYELSYDPIAPELDTTEVEVTATHKTANIIPATKTIDGIVVTAEAQPELDSIVVKTNPTKMTYNEGESFDPAGLVITASYTLDKASDDKTYGVDEGIVCEVADPLTTLSTTVTVKYTEGGKTVQTTLTITVNRTHVNTVEAAYKNAGSTEPQTFEGVVSATQGNSFVVADGDYAILVYNYTGLSGVAVGKKVSITAKVTDYNGLIETADKSVTASSITGEAAVPENVEVTSVSQLDSINTSVLVSAQIEVVSKEAKWDGSNTNNWTVKINGTSVTLSLNKYTYNKASGDILKALEVGDKFVAHNLIVGSYNNVRQLATSGESTFAKFVPEITGLTIGGDFTKKSYSKGANWDISGLTFTGTTADGSVSLTPNDLNFEFSPATATDSSVTSVTVTAKYKANTEISAQITITGITVSDIETKDYTLTYTSAKDPDGLTSSPTAGNFESSGSARAAQWSNNEGLTLTTGSYSGVTKIVLTTSTNADNDAYEISCTVGGNAFGETISMQKGNNMELIFEDEAASGEIVITYTLKGNKKSIYVKSLVITAQ